jgi:hypothetical protein
MLRHFKEQSGRQEGENAVRLRKVSQCQWQATSACRSEKDNVELPAAVTFSHLVY